MANSGEFDAALGQNDADLQAFAAVLEARHGSFAFEIAEFYATWHGQRGDFDRSSAWVEIAETIKTRGIDRLLDHHQ